MKYFSEEARRKLSEAKKDSNHPLYGRHHSEETRRKMSENRKGITSGSKNSFYGKHHSEESRRKMSEAKTGSNHFNYGKHLSEETRRKLSESKKGSKNPNYCKSYSEETRRKLSEASKKNWNKESYRQKMYQPFKLLPTTPEFAVGLLLDQLGINAEYIGDGSKWIGRRNPDFIIRDKRKLIEVFGDYWHKEDNPQDRINHFRKYRYETLIIWESELKNEFLLKRKLIKFQVG